jgi:hypothetical protein
MPNRGKFIGNDNLYVPDAPTIGATSGAVDGEVSVAFTAPSDVGGDAITAYGASVTDGTNVIGATGSSSPVTVTGLTNGTSYTAQVWAINNYGNGPLSAATASFSPVPPNFVFTVAGLAGSSSNVIDKVSVNFAGNATDFGDLTNDTYYTTAFGNNTRGIHAGGYSDTASGAVNVIDYFSLTSSGNAVDFGDLSAVRRELTGFSNNVRGIVAGGRLDNGNRINVVEYITIQTTGNATDFGDFAVGDRSSLGGASSSTRGLMFGGHNGSAVVDIIEYATIASVGNTVDFGNLSAVRTQAHAVASSTRAVVGGGNTGSAVVDIIEYVTIANTGNATDFGNLAIARQGVATGGNATTGLFLGGHDSGTVFNTIENITFSTTGNATDWGDLSVARGFAGGHGDGEPAVQNETGFAPAAIGLVAGGSPRRTTIEYIDIASTGNGQMFGDLSQGRYSENSASSSTRYLVAGGYGGSGSFLFNIIDFSTFSTKGKATDFGDLSETSRFGVGGVSNGTRAVFGIGRGASATVDKLEYVTIASAGDSTDFGNLVSANFLQGSGVNSTTRGIFGGAGGAGQATYGPVMQYITIASTGNATDFGDLTVALYARGAVCSSTRGVYGGGGDAQSNVMDYITIASTGNATDFGDLTIARYVCAQGCSSSTRGVFAGHDTSFDSSKNIYDYITIASTGNATDFGDMVDSHAYGNAGSNAHGGIA